MSDVAAASETGLPALDPITGCLPPGRHPATLDTIRATFVEAAEFSESDTRAARWSGLIAYVTAWEQIEDLLGERMVLAWWIGGSFVSSAINVADVDITPVLDRDVWNRNRGTVGMGKAKALIRHRQKVVDEFGVEPFVLLWSAVSCTLFPEDLPAPEQEMLRDRGGLDAWWQRCRPAGAKVGPARPTAFAERGYLEVLR